MTLVGMVTLAGCVSLLPLQQLLRETEADLERFESGEMAHWGPICASRELALARAHHAFAKIRPKFSTINGADPVHIGQRLLSTYRTQFHCQGTETLIPTRNTATLFEVVTVGT